MTWSEWLAQVQRMMEAWKGQRALANGQSDACGTLLWITGMDPGKATGLAQVVYLVPPAPVEVADTFNVERASRGEPAWGKHKVSSVGYAVDTWSKVLAGIRAQNVPGGLLPTYDATGAIVLTWFSEFLSGDENAMVRKAVSRYRQLSNIWEGEGVGLATCERFTVLRADSSVDYVSPIRVRAAFAYALEDEFGIRTLGVYSSDALSEFGPLQLKHLGMYPSGPDHVRDALGHGLFGIRKEYSE